ncbi:MAG: hypothetical protein M3Z19_13605, partial [Chloroflexota bacterium]|nr:hypothetical protein [Chloroflexota bacterium]
MIVFAFAGDSTITSRAPSAIGGIAAYRPPVLRLVRAAPPLGVRVAVVRRVVGGFVALVVVLVVVRFVGVFAGAFVAVAVVLRGVFVGAFVFIVSSG